MDPIQAISDFGALIFLAGGGVIALAIIAKRYEARLLSEADFLRTANSAFAAALDRLTEEVRALRDERKAR